ncbi:hypothetical protein BDB00DRAFT_23638 [Zychaea mexicana]|uniref:uncharacterized protein n=1 Tax=Zychaea mexicana TaxID=64656 RepID=UPI0022FE87CD|nr:uncharacterized protein BDB00DRAFT_23638 [Zychaea mexicana]KAI9497305.1 hypothetical protein BDB00DRAFT_23638 [Zychaea mexicana]
MLYMVLLIQLLLCCSSKYDMRACGVAGRILSLHDFKRVITEKYHHDRLFVCLYMPLSIKASFIIFSIQYAPAAAVDKQEEHCFKRAGSCTSSKEGPKKKRADNGKTFVPTRLFIQHMMAETGPREVIIFLYWKELMQHHDFKAKLSQLL